jgi:hypothetical protein
LEVRPYDASRAQAWNAFNAGGRNGHLLFDRGFMDYHADRFADASLMAFEGETLVGLLPANVSGDTVWSHQGLTFGGLVVNDVRAVEVTAILDACAAAWAGQGARKLVYKALPAIYHRRPAQEDLSWLYRRGARLARRDLSTAIDLTAPGPVSSRRARGARKAAGAGVTFGRSDRWGDYWALLETVLAARHGAAATHSLAEIKLLAVRFPEAITLHIAEREGEVLAGVVMFRSGPVAHAQYIATGDEGRTLGALDGLFLHLIEGERGIRRWFDFGHSTTDQGHTLNEGLVRQKEEFGGGGVVHDVYELDLT